MAIAMRGRCNDDNGWWVGGYRAFFFEGAQNDAVTNADLVGNPFPIVFILNTELHFFLYFTWSQFFVFG